MIKHTPGPWSVLSAYGGKPSPIFYNIACGAGHIVAMVDENASPYDGNEVHIEEAEANARLMAAAPELLALANRVANLNEHAGEIGSGMLASLVEEARSAVAKATGAT